MVIDISTMTMDAPMLTTQELTDARERLCQAKALVTGVRDLFFSGGDVSGARLLKRQALRAPREHRGKEA
jgi:hypothetical protein